MTHILPIFFILIIFQGCSHAPEVAYNSAPLAADQAFPEIPLKDQFDQDVILTKTTPWVLFSKEKEVNKIIHSVLQNYKSSTKTFVYVADISAMPSLVTSLFALPKMRKYPYPIALDKSGAFTKLWPTQPGAATFFKLKDGKIEAIRYIKTADELSKEIQ